MSPRVVRVGVVGTGWWATTHHLPALAGHPGARLAGVVDHDRARARKVAAAWGTTPYDDVAALLPEVDAVVVATPHDTHHDVVMACLAARRHVLVEKPLALTTGDAVEMVTAAERAGVHLVVGYTHQFDDVAGFARDAVRQQIGRLVQVTVEYSSRAGRLYAAAEGRPLAARADPGTQHPETYGAEHGGGQARTQLTHALAMLCWATGQEVTTVVAVTDDHGLAVDVDDAVVFRLSGGASGVAVSSGATPPGVPVRQHIRYQGTDGVVDHDLFRAEATLYRTDGSRLLHEHGQHEPPYRAGEPARRFIDLIAVGGANPSPARPAAAAVAAVEAVLESARRGIAVTPSRLPTDHEG